MNDYRYFGSLPDHTDYLIGERFIISNFDEMLRLTFVKVSNGWLFCGEQLILSEECEVG